MKFVRKMLVDWVRSPIGGKPSEGALNNDISFQSLNSET
jgi:hypothetical protein